MKSSLTFFSIRNWEKFQHYKKRNPPWIRLYQSLLRQREYQKLSDTARSHLIGIFILAAQHSNQIPNDPEWLQHELCTKHPIDLKTLSDSGWIILSEQDASVALAECTQVAAPDPDNSETDNSETQSQITAEKRGVLDLAYEHFAAQHRELLGAAYVSKTADFVMLAKVRKANGIVGKELLENWHEAVTNYFSSPLSAWTLADLCARYPLFRNSAVDEYQKPLNHQGRTNGQKTDKHQRNTETARRLLSRPHSQDSGGVQRGVERSHSGDLSPFFAEIIGKPNQNGRGKID